MTACWAPARHLLGNLLLTSLANARDILGICQAPARFLLDRTEVRPSGWRLEPMIANLKRAACWINFYAKISRSIASLLHPQSGMGNV